MYPNIEMLFFKKKLKKREIAEAMGIGYNTLLYKLNGKYPITFDEAVKMKELLETELPIEILFSKNENDNKSA